MVIDKVPITDSPLSHQVLVQITPNGQLSIDDVAIEPVEAAITRVVRTAPLGNFIGGKQDFVEVPNGVAVFQLVEIYNYLAF